MAQKYETGECFGCPSMAGGSIVENTNLFAILNIKVEQMTSDVI